MKPLTKGDHLGLDSGSIIFHMNFSIRDTGLQERMDDPECDDVLLWNTYHQFTRVNRLFVGWYGIYRRLIRPSLRDCERTHTLLDLGCGGGGMLPVLQRWAHQDGFDLNLTGIDTDPRFMSYVGEQTWPVGISFRVCSSTDLVREGSRFDVVICNHVIHHLADQAVRQLLDEVKMMTDRVAVISDPVRSRFAYVLFSMVAVPLFRNSFIVEDGQFSIRRSFRPAELRQLAPSDWDIVTRFPYRQFLVYRAPDSPHGRGRRAS